MYYAVHRDTCTEQSGDLQNLRREGISQGRRGSQQTAGRRRSKSTVGVYLDCYRSPPGQGRRGGRPCRGNEGAGGGCGLTKGFTCSSEIESVWSGLRWMMTVFLVCLTTGKGLTYLGESGGFTASTWM